MPKSRQKRFGGKGVATSSHPAVPPWATTLAGLVIVALAVSLALHSGRVQDGGPPTLAVGGSTPGISSQDEQLRRLAVGTWRDFYQGKRTMTLREDGTATMVVELSGLKARLFTPRLELDIVWSVEKGRLKRRTVGGTPPDKIAFVNKRAGERVAEPIVELTKDRLLLLDKDGTRKYDWRRLR